MYLFAWILNYLFLGAAKSRAISMRHAAVAAVLVFGALAILRGPTVGPDTGLYQHFASLFLSGQTIGSVDLEPGFMALLYLLAHLTESPVYAVRGVALVFTALMLVFAYRANRDESWYLLAVFVPMSFIPYSINGERIGMAIVVMLLSLQEYRLRHRRSAFMLFLLPLLFHFSSLIIIVYVFLVETRVAKKRYYVAMVIAILCVIAFIMTHSIYISRKFALYLTSGYYSPSILSGGSSLIEIAVILGALSYFRLCRDVSRRILFITVPAALVFFIIARHSYAGLRLLSLLVFALSYVLMRTFARSDGELNKRGRIVFMMLGLIGAGFVYQHMLTEPAGGIHRFLPYEFLSELY